MRRVFTQVYRTRSTSQRRLLPFCFLSHQRRYFGNTRVFIKDTAEALKREMDASADSIVTIDCKYEGDDMMTSYLLTEGNNAAFVDNNTQHAVPILLQNLTDNKINGDQVKFLIVTHVHLDHASGTAALLKHCPNATVLCHPRAAPHLIDPSKLMAGVRAVYGDAETERMYGNMEPINAERVVAVEDGGTVFLGDSDTRPLKFHFVRGHANHHIVIHDIDQKAIFTGDAFGVCYQNIFKKYSSNPSNDMVPFLFPSSSPIDFIAEEAKKSVDLIANSGATTAYLAHTAGWTDLKGGAKMMHEALDYFATLMTAIEARLLFETEDQVEEWTKEQMTSFFIKELKTREIDMKKDDGFILKTLATDIDLNASGLVVAVQRILRRRAKADAAALEANKKMKLNN